MAANGPRLPSISKILQLNLSTFQGLLSIFKHHYHNDFQGWGGTQKNGNLISKFFNSIHDHPIKFSASVVKLLQIISTAYTMSKWQFYIVMTVQKMFKSNNYKNFLLREKTQLWTCFHMLTLCSHLALHTVKKLNIKSKQIYLIFTELL